MVKLAASSILLPSLNVAAVVFVVGS